MMYAMTMPGKTECEMASPMNASRRTITYAPIAPQVAPTIATSMMARTANW